MMEVAGIQPARSDTVRMYTQSPAFLPIVTAVPSLRLSTTEDPASGT